MEFLPAGTVPIGPIRRGNSPGCRREMFHALYMPSAASEPPVVRVPAVTFVLHRLWTYR